MLIVLKELWAILTCDWVSGLVKSVCRRAPITNIWHNLILVKQNEEVPNELWAILKGNFGCAKQGANCKFTMSRAKFLRCR